MPKDEDKSNTDYETHSFILLGKTGAGKSSLCNCIAKEKDKFKVGDSFESCTSLTSSQTIKNEENKCNLFVIDTPGFEDSEGRDDKNIESMKQYIKDNERIKSVIIVIDFRITRVDLSLKKSIKTIAELFPLDNFWSHVIIVWSHYNQKDTKTKAKIQNTFMSSLNDLFDDLNRDFRISKPNNINMKFIDSDPELTGQEKIDSEKETNQLIKDIIDMKPMYKEIKDGPEEDVIDDPIEGIKQNNDIQYNYKKRVMRTFIDFDDKKIEKEYIKEKYIITKKENICQEVEEPLSVEDNNQRNNYIQKENQEFKDLEEYKKTKRNNTKKFVKYKEYQYFKNQEKDPYKTETTNDIIEEWIEEDVTETKSNNIGHRINYTVYQYKQKIKNKYTSFEDISQKKVIETYYEEKYETYENEGKFDGNGEGTKYKIKYEQFKSSKDGKLKGDKKLIRKYIIERKWYYYSWEKINDNNYKRKKELKEYDEETGRTISIMNDVDNKTATWKYEECGDDCYTENGNEEEEYIEYHTLYRRKIYEIDGNRVDYGERERYNDYRIIAEIKLGKTTRKDLNDEDVEETIERELKIYDEKNHTSKYKKLKPITKRINNYYRVYEENREEEKSSFENSDMKDKDNEPINYKHYTIKEFKRKIRKGKNGENIISDWYISNERERKNIKCDMTYRRGEYTGNYSYKWFAWAKWDHHYEYKFYKQLVRTYDDGTIERDPEIYRGSWKI